MIKWHLRTHWWHVERGMHIVRNLPFWDCVSKVESAITWYGFFVKEMRSLEIHFIHQVMSRSPFRYAPAFEHGLAFSIVHRSVLDALHVCSLKIRASKWSTSKLWYVTISSEIFLICLAIFTSTVENRYLRESSPVHQNSMKLQIERLHLL